MAAGASDDERRIPSLAPGWNPSGRSLTPAEGFLLSRIDGRTPWTLLRQIGGLSAEDVDRCLQRWLSEGIVVMAGVGGSAGSDSAAVGGDASSPGGPAATGPEGALDPDLDISIDLQRRILACEASLERPYHELLGVPPGADGPAIKRAYFELSKLYHPDRYFRLNIGNFHARLERIFRKMVEAYELLSDPATRKEVERSAGPIPEAAEKAPEAATAGARRERPSAWPTKWEMLERLRRKFRVPQEILAERRFKARQFYESSRLAARRERWFEAAASVRLAIAFDPWNDEYKEGFAEVQAKVHQMRAAELLEKANASWDASAQQEAMALYEEALSYRPSDPEVNDRAAALALELGDLDRAREYAENACGICPENAAYHRTLSRVLRGAGLRDKARDALETARRLDPEDAETRAELDSLRRLGRRPR